jgi:uracil-DNA glycosylase
MEASGDNYEAMDGLSPEDADELRARLAWRDPWPGIVRPCTEELDEVERLRATGQPVFPARGLETAALYLLPFSDVRVVMLGIDPYPNAQHATGLAFSVPAKVRSLPPAVLNLRKAAVADGWTPDGGPGWTGDLTYWVRQGVLLLNRALTFSPTNSENVAGVHLPIWQNWTDAVITALDEREKPPVFVLMGEDAKKVGPLIERGPVVERAHPSAPGLQNEFRDSGLFTEINSLLGADGIDGIDWSL